MKSKGICTYVINPLSLLVSEDSVSVFQTLISYKENNSFVPFKQLFLLIFFSPLILKELTGYNNISYTYIFLHKDGPYFLFGEFSIRDCRYEPCCLANIELISCQIRMNTPFWNKYERKRIKYDTNIHKSMIIYDRIFKLIRSCL